MIERMLRGDNRNDPVVEAIVTDPAITTAIAKTRHEKMQRTVSQALQATEDRKLAGWVAVVVWEDETGNIEHSVIGDQNSTFRELKSYLHDGVRAAAQTDH